MHRYTQQRHTQCWIKVVKCEESGHTKHVTLLVWYWATITQVVTTGKVTGPCFIMSNIACKQMYHYLKNKPVEDKRAVIYSRGGYDYHPTSLRHTAWNGDKRTVFKSSSNSQDKTLPNKFYFWPQYLVRGQHALLVPRYLFSRHLLEWALWSTSICWNVWGSVASQ